MPNFLFKWICQIYTHSYKYDQEGKSALYRYLRVTGMSFSQEATLDGHDLETPPAQPPLDQVSDAKVGRGYQLHAEHRSYPGNGTVYDPYIVDWNLADPANPYNWSKRRKWLITMQVRATPDVVDGHSNRIAALSG